MPKGKGLIISPKPKIKTLTDVIYPKLTPKSKKVETPQILCGVRG